MMPAMLAYARCCSPCPLRDEREALPFPHTATSTVSIPCPARGARLHPVALHCTAPPRLKRQLSRASVSQPAQARSSPRPERARTACAQCPAYPPHCRPSPDPTAVDPLSSSRLCSCCKPRLVDTLQLPLRLTQRMCSDLSCAACARPCSCCHPSPDPCRTATARRCARCGGGPPPLWLVGALFPARRFANSRALSRMLASLAC